MLLVRVPPRKFRSKPHRGCERIRELPTPKLFLTFYALMIAENRDTNRKLQVLTGKSFQLAK